MMCWRLQASVIWRRKGHSESKVWCPARGVYPFADNTTLEDLIIQAGGLLDGASTVRVDVARRLKDSKSLEPSSTLSKVFSFAVKDGFVIEGTPGFVLQPYDMVEVRKSPAYQVQRRVSIDGEVVFAGGYTLIRKNERISVW